MPKHIIWTLVHEGYIRHGHGHRWISSVDGQVWKSAYDAAMHALRFIVGA